MNYTSKTIKENSFKLFYNMPSTNPLEFSLECSATLVECAFIVAIWSCVCDRIDEGMVKNSSALVC